MEWLQQHILWWHWIVLGILLIVLEILLPGFVLLWFGVAAIVVGVVDYLFHPSFDTLLYLWSGLSVVSLLVWFGYFKKTPRSLIGQAEGEFAHITGEVVEKIDQKRYKAVFDLPVLGDREWIVESHEPLEIGDKIEVVKVFGQILKVKRKRT